MSVNEHLAARPSAGMIVRSRESLEIGLVFFKLGHRFVNRRRLGDIEVMSSPWWFTQATAELICGSSMGSGNDLSEAFRRFGAVAKRWGGTGDLVVKATLRSRVTAFIGPGTVQDFRSDKAQADNNVWDMPLWVPPSSIPQIYIPLMMKGQPKSSVAREAFESAYIMPIDKWDHSYIHEHPDQKWKCL